METTYDNCLVVMAKRPEPGHVKTRLIPCLGEKGATELYEALLSDTVGNMRKTRATRRVIAYSPDGEGAWFDAMAEGFYLRGQGEGDLGQRMERLFGWAFGQGATRVVIVGTDLPTLPGQRVEQALEQLDVHPVVLGPATDGGYYLVGLRRPTPELFRDVAWSTASVLTQTLDKAERLGLKVMMLPGACDVDDEESLHMLRLELRDAEKRYLAPKTTTFLEGNGRRFGKGGR